MKLSLATAALAAVLGAGLLSGSAFAHDYRYDQSYGYSGDEYRGDRDDRRFEHRCHRRAYYGQYSWSDRRRGDWDDRRRGDWKDRGRGHHHDRDWREDNHRGDWDDRR